MMKPLLTLCGVLTATVSIVAQVPRYDAASVRASEPGALGSSWAGRGSVLTIQNYSLLEIIRGALQLPPYRVVGGPDWIANARFDIVARAPEGVTRDIAMLRALLTERFGLKTHTETRQIPIYTLVLARSDRRLGPQLRPSKTDCAVTRCTATVLSGKVQTNGYSMAQLAGILTANTDRMVLDRTGLEGVYDLELAWSLDDSPGLFTALVEQLGLKLEPGVGPVEVVVIDAVQRPTPD
jgi:uncharacterized protein (TIGR03435 family)